MVYVVLNARDKAVGGNERCEVEQHACDVREVARITHGCCFGQPSARPRARMRKPGAASLEIMPAARNVPNAYSGASLDRLV